jgi:hypothetical protein
VRYRAARKASLLAIAPRAMRFKFKPMVTRSSRQPSAWSLEKLSQATRRLVEARRRQGSPSAPPPPPAVTTQPRQQDVVALGIVNLGRTREGLPPLAKLPELGLEQPRVGPIDAVKLAAAIVEAGRVARAEVPVPLPADPVARAIVEAGERAAGGGKEPDHPADQRRAVSPGGEGQSRLPEAQGRRRFEQLPGCFLSVDLHPALREAGYQALTGFLGRSM